MNSNPSTTSTTSSPPGASTDAISRRAYELWEKEGRPEGNDLRHWLQAESELGDGRSAPGSGNYTDTPRARPQANDARPLPTIRAAGAAPNRENKRPSASPFASEKSSNGAATAATRRRN